ncbi:polyprenyl synthetase family protein [Hyalangium rubrum]|uniref:Farnesyl diphosphate synthase n=1 Tax=Hyalangium rubrum TaxID=3103134 RepID=A0ABU5H7I8_9BACT|nr:farnesyl diphosphate synthase [Hyalangium sp. s54d21]MDY7229446.1 farnesyl diphosphate synthase [Hyalangium sp. s54d21]
MNALELQSFLRVQQVRVENLLRSRAEPLESSGAPVRLAEAMRYSLLAGGKRLRPILCLVFADTLMPQGSSMHVAEDAACALEFVHTYSLIHDDLPSMDDDDLRRGRPTSHKVFGEAMAILAGDALFSEAFVLLASGTEPVRSSLCRELAVSSGATGMVGGQVLDIAEDRPAQLDYLKRLHRLKTGALVRAACRMGVMAAGGSEDALARADSYGDAIGLAFQIADDILDVTGSAEAMGKPVGADAAAGRHTFPAVIGLEASWVLAERKVSEALAAVEPLEGKDGPLAALARYMVERNR